MSVEQYQRTVNSLDKDIADLEKKKAAEDKKATENHKKAASVSISKSASESTIKSKMKQIEGYESTARKAEKASADYAKKIADKRKKRNDAYLRLQKEEQAERKKQEKSIENMKRMYEQRISDLESTHITAIKKEMYDDSISVEENEYDVFVSHAWEDKESFADEFVETLRNKGLSVWYDTSHMKWGDSMRARIDDGLSKSRFGVVILSPNYLAENKYWTKAELDGLFQLESINGKMILPVWHNLTKKDVMDYSPLIAGRKALTTALMTPGEIADELVQLLSEGEK